MEQLTVNKIFDMVNKLHKSGMKYQDIMNLPIYLGDDDELNGVHCGWFVELIDAKDEHDNDIVEMINESSGNYPLKNKAILIS